MAESVAIRKMSSILDELHDMQNRITRRAYEIFENNGAMPGKDFEHWLQAERELLWKPAIELRETNGGFLLEAAISGVDPKDVDIEITPDDIVLKDDVRHEHRADKGKVHICEFKIVRIFHLIHFQK